MPNAIKCGCLYSDARLCYDVRHPLPCDDMARVDERALRDEMPDIFSCDCECHEDYSEPDYDGPDDQSWQPINY